MRAIDLIEAMEPIVGFDTALTIAEIISAKWGGCKELIFCPSAVTRIVRNQQLRFLADSGMTTEDAADRYGVSERHARRIIEG